MYVAHALSLTGAKVFHILWMLPGLPDAKSMEVHVVVMYSVERRDSSRT